MMLFEIGQKVVPASAVDVAVPAGPGEHMVTLRSGLSIQGYVSTVETIPNTTRLEAVRVWDPFGSDGYSVEPIVAWRVTTPLDNYQDDAQGSPCFILQEPLASNEVVGILDPATGVVTLPGDRTFPSVEEFVAEVGRRRKAT